MAENQESQQERTEEPTERRRQQFRKDGKIPVSRDVIMVVGMLCVLPVAAAGGAAGMAHFGDLIRAPLGWTCAPADALDTVRVWFPALILRALGIIAPMLAVVWAVSLVAGLAQTQGNVTFKVLEPKLDKLNPAQGVKKLVGGQAWIELLKSLLKLAAVGAAVWIVARAHGPRLLALDRVDLPLGLSVIGEVILYLGLATALALLAAAVVDYGIQIYRTNKQMKMTREEVKRDLKEEEGDPYLRSKRRQLAQGLSSNRMIAAVPDADVVINNPEHLSVALRYVHGETEVPVVVAKGAEQMALRIRAEARRHQIPQLQNRPLARRLYQKADVGGPIPEELYGAIAEILVFVHRIKGLRGMPRAASGRQAHDGASGKGR